MQDPAYQATALVVEVRLWATFEDWYAGRSNRPCSSGDYQPVLQSTQGQANRNRAILMHTCTFEAESVPLHAGLVE